MFIILFYQNVVGPFQRIFISGQEKHDVVASILSQQGFSERLVCSLLLLMSVIPFLFFVAAYDQFFFLPQSKPIFLVLSGDKNLLHHFLKVCWKS